jgi:hypothetical protein
MITINRMMHEIKLKDQKRLMLLSLIEDYYITDGAGGTCHIILEDGNYKDSHINMCLKYSKEQNDFWGETIATLLTNFTEEEREEIVERGFEIRNRLSWFN